MTLNEYQEECKKFAVYKDAGTGSANAIVYNALALGEAGEVQGKVSKLIYRNDGTLTKQDLVKELGDLFWHLTMLAAELGIPLQHIAIINLLKLQSRKERNVLKGSGDNR